MTVVACTGLAVLDLVFTTTAPLNPGHKNFASTLHASSGGPVVNASKAIVDLGGSAIVTARVGDDAAGAAIRSDLVARGVAPELTVVEGIRSSTSAAVVDPTGERTIVNATDQRLVDLEPVDIDSIVGRADAVLVDARWVAGARATLSAARNAAIPAVLDADSSQGALPSDLLTAATHTIFSQDALARFTGTDNPHQGIEAVASATDGVVAVTLGSGGSLWVVEGRVVAVDAFVVDVASTLGAGDVFHGVFALEVAHAADVEAAARTASAAAAVFCTQPLGSDRRITREEVQQLEAVT